MRDAEGVADPGPGHPIGSGVGDGVDLLCRQGIVPGSACLVDQDVSLREGGPCPLEEPRLLDRCLVGRARGERTLETLVVTVRVVRVGRDVCGVVRGPLARAGAVILEEPSHCALGLLAPSSLGPVESLAAVQPRGRLGLLLDETSSLGVDPGQVRLGSCLLYTSPSPRDS